MLSGSPELPETGPQENSRNIAALLLKIWSIRANDFKYFAEDFGEVPWNIMLDLTCSAHHGKTVVASDLAITYDVPKTTMNRYVDYLHNIGLVEKKRDADNRVRVLLSLTDEANDMMTQTLSKIAAEMGKAPV
ncbi:MarR family winged helix-turn-helix transcriptional regulator [Parasphingorhabdus marina]|nr:MarR family winged helix-turn-helix transcriptional regulator [Parasphingorhabdus marina]